MRGLMPATLMIVCLSQPVSAQIWQRMFNPDVQVTLHHPPTLGMKIKRIAFAPVNSRVAEDLVAACIVDLSQNSELDIIDRGNVDKVLQEQQLSQSGLVNSQSAVELGRLLGSPVMLFVKVLRCTARQIPLSSTKEGWSDSNGKYYPPVTTYISKTQVEFNGSIQAVDLATGKIYNQLRLSFTPFQETSSTEGRPEYPTELAVTEMAINLARSEVRKLLLGWTESRTLIFYNDKDYGMKEGYQRLKGNDTPGALAKSLEALSSAKADPKVKEKYLGRTNYNVGMCHFIMGDLRSAMPFLQAARGIEPDNGIFKDAEIECQRAIALEDEMRRVDEKSAQATLNFHAQPPSTVVNPQADSKPSAPPKPHATPEERIKKLQQLKERGLITEDEYRAKRAEILKDI